MPSHSTGSTDADTLAPPPGLSTRDDTTYPASREEWGGPAGTIVAYLVNLV